MMAPLLLRSLNHLVHGGLGYAQVIISRHIQAIGNRLQFLQKDATINKPIQDGFLNQHQQHPTNSLNSSGQLVEMHFLHDKTSAFKSGSHFQRVKPLCTVAKTNFVWKGV